MLTDLEKKIIANIQGDMPVCPRPYLEIAQKLEIDEETVLSVLADLQQRGIIRRFGATLKHQNSGFAVNAMIAWRVDEDRVEEVGSTMAGFDRITHCYRRNPSGEWPYNLYTMVHAADREEFQKIAEAVAEKTGVSDYAILFSKRELKKTSMQYFDDDPDFSDPD